MSSQSNDYRISPETMSDLESMASTCNVESARDIFQALSDDRRLTIMRLLGESELCVCDMVELFDIEYSKLSYHLKKLKEASLVEADREGNYVTYRPTERGEDVIEIVRSMC
ncbi:ArsR/SmtB family transcription factor [Halapricum hydrolyticum]|uniref:Metalloregulator ArsR/SmtB family transcription factor n=1 Tax=Halapricum hydrolyticum TaxID=2979991 RepID=A0AAE3IBY1_9EURY|nr:metalloregulator ArsR/SmtB family transcription factor [Halapricum hydrolyticum]MCU4718794.1 metalloregulator ArsR/SmtB family transcription factor [Halapricum hydrolyticum]MCU4727798.1 metalloregulator ArsR/SmtB family transcription factor [Halapricum hydrolyticum]